MPRGISWSFNETDALIRLWADSTTQTALRLNSRNRCIYEDIANQLQALGITRTADQCQMRIKLLKKMYRQTNEAIKRGDVFQQRPCPFYNEMHRIFSGGDENNNLSNSQLLSDDEGEDNLDEEDIQQEKISNEDKLIQAIDRLIEYQQQTENRWYQYLEQQANLEQQRRQEDRVYQLQLIQLLSNFVSSNEQRSYSPESKKAKLRHPSLPSNFYSLLAQIHNIDESNA